MWKRFEKNSNIVVALIYVPTLAAAYFILWDCKIIIFIVDKWPALIASTELVHKNTVDDNKVNAYDKTENAPSSKMKETPSSN